MSTPSTHRHPVNRPWYAHVRLTDEYCSAIERGDGDFEMLRTLKLIRSILVIVAVSTVSLYALYLGADPTVVALLALPSLAAYAGAEAIDYGALLQAYRESTTERGDE